MSSYEKPHFSTLDYALFGGSLAFSLLIGFYYGLCRRQRTPHTTKEELFAGGQLGALPVAMTLVATFMSAISLLGYPAEIYQFGTMFYYYGLMYFLAFPLAAFLFLPVLYKLRLSSAYQYLELRFDSKVRRVASTIFCVQTVLYLSVGLYAPALTLNAVTDVPLYATILVTGLVCVLYTTVGGAKTVVWTNVYQVALIVGGLAAVVVTGIRHVGGFGNVWELSRRGGRIFFEDFSPDPRIRHSFWSLIIGGTFTILTLYSVNQMTVQRYMSMKSLKEAQIALLLNIPLNLTLISLYTVIGLVLFASFFGCDPKKAGLIKKAEEILPYFVMNNLSYLKGLPGVFVSAVYGAGLSTVAGGLNALSAVVLEDFVKPLHKWQFNGRTIDEHIAARTCKVLAFSFGLCTVGLAYMFTFIEAPILQISLTLFGVGGGPILGVFCLGLFFRRPNAKGALVGLLIGASLTALLGFSPLIAGLAPTPMPVSTENCGHYFKINHNATFTGFADPHSANAEGSASWIWSSTNSSQAKASPSFNFSDARNAGQAVFGYNSTVRSAFVAEKPAYLEFLTQIGRLSYQFYSLFAVCVVLLFGYLASVFFDTLGKKSNFDSDQHAGNDKSLRIDWAEVFSCSFFRRTRHSYSIPGNSECSAIPMKG